MNLHEPPLRPCFVLGTILKQRCHQSEGDSITHPRVRSEPDVFLLWGWRDAVDHYGGDVDILGGLLIAQRDGAEETGLRVEDAVPAEDLDGRV